MSKGLSHFETMYCYFWLLFPPNHPRAKALFVFMLSPIPFTTGELGSDGLNEARKNGPSYAKSVVYI